MHGIIYKFENQNIQIFFENMKLMEDFLFPIYFDFETTSGKIHMRLWLHFIQT